MTEEWRAIKGYEGSYEVSSSGRIRSLDRHVLGKDGRLELHRGKELKPWSLKNGYSAVSLSGKKRTVHSLVAEAFIGEKPKGMDVMHLDGNRSNNVVSNLSYGTRSSNLRQTYDYGGRCANGKLFKGDALDVKRRLLRGESPMDLAKEYGVNSAAIYHIRSGKTFGWLKGDECNARST